ncbi:MAG: signal peptide peptidase SppA [Bacteroidetes bacterium]|nr:signal peptide peptidase SppA [Bacteroidota bacterium]
MKNFIKTTLSFTLGFLLSVLIIIILISVSLKFKTGFHKYYPKNNSILIINLKGKVYEDSPLKSILEKKNRNTSLIKIIESINYAKKDPKIKGIKLNIDNFQAGWASLEEIKKKLIDFKKSKKFIISFSEIYSNKSYYLSSVANKVFLHPEGMFIWPGLSVKYFYYKRMFKRLRINPIEFHVGEYKSYGEKFYKSSMSKYSREQTEALLFSLYDELLDTVSLNRNLDKIKIKELATNLNIKTSKDALNNGLIDNLYYKDQIETYLKERLNIKKKADINYVNIDDYFNYKFNQSSSKNQIAILIAEGQIMNGKSKYGEIIGSKDFIKTIEKIKKNKKIKGVILRINSPGGDVLASGDIHRSLQLLNKEKPVITSMSDLAASGGYYIAMGTDYIFANKNTITGSIGVLSLFFNTGRLFREYLGITNSSVSTEPHADIFSGYAFGLQRSLDFSEKRFVQAIIDNYYQDFINKVAKARNKKPEEIDIIARGRVWIGTTAKEIGLVDEIGTLNDAIKKVAKKAKLKDYTISYWPKKKSFYETIFESPIKQIKSCILKSVFGNKYELIKKAQNIQKMNNYQAIVPYEIKIN